MKVWIAQLKCPQNHCVIAVASELPGENTSTLEASLLAGFENMIEQGLINRECGLCKSTQFHVEVGKTAFESIDEAGPSLAVEQRNQWATAEFLKQSKN